MKRRRTRNLNVLASSLKKHLCSKGFPVELVHFKSYDALVDGLDQSNVDVAWNSPLSHAQ